jgi:hypothetical protein
LAGSDCAFAFAASFAFAAFVFLAVAIVGPCGVPV